MITIKLGEKNYHIDFISGRALRELEPAAQMRTAALQLPP